MIHGRRLPIVCYQIVYSSNVNNFVPEIFVWYNTILLSYLFQWIQCSILPLEVGNNCTTIENDWQTIEFFLVQQLTKKLGLEKNSKVHLFYSMETMSIFVHFKITFVIWKILFSEYHYKMNCHELTSCNIRYNFI